MGGRPEDRLVKGQAEGPVLGDRQDPRERRPSALCHPDRTHKKGSPGGDLRLGERRRGPGEEEEAPGYVPFPCGCRMLCREERRGEGLSVPVHHQRQLRRIHSHRRPHVICRQSRGGRRIGEEEGGHRGSGDGPSLRSHKRQGLRDADGVGT